MSYFDPQLKQGVVVWSKCDTNATSFNTDYFSCSDLASSRRNQAVWLDAFIIDNLAFYYLRRLGKKSSSHVLYSTLLRY